MTARHWIWILATTSLLASAGIVAALRYEPEAVRTARDKARRFDLYCGYLASEALGRRWNLEKTPDQRERVMARMQEELPYRSPHGLDLCAPNKTKEPPVQCIVDRDHACVIAYLRDLEAALSD